MLFFQVLKWVNKMERFFYVFSFGVHDFHLSSLIRFYFKVLNMKGSAGCGNVTLHGLNLSDTYCQILYALYAYKYNEYNIWKHTQTIEMGNDNNCKASNNSVLCFSIEILVYNHLKKKTFIYSTYYYIVFF